MSIIYDNINAEVVIDAEETMRDILTLISSIDPTKANLTGDVGWITDVNIITEGIGSVLIDNTLELVYKYNRRYIVLVDGISISLDGNYYEIQILEEGINLLILDDDINIIIDSNFYNLLLETDLFETDLDIDKITVNVQCGSTLIPKEELVKKITGEDVGGFRVVTTNNEGYIIHATVDRVLAGKSAIGITTHAVLANDSCDIGVTGDEITEETWNWDTAESIYLGADGILTQEVPVDNFLMMVAVPLSPTSLRVRIEPPIFL